MELEGVPVKIIGKEETSFTGGARYCPPGYDVLALNIAGRTAPAPNDLIVFTGRPDMPILLVEARTSAPGEPGDNCFLWDLEKNDYLEGVTDPNGLPVSWPVSKSSVDDWLAAHLSQAAANETILETSHPMSPPYPQCATSSGWLQAPAATIYGLVIEVDEICPEASDYAVDTRAGAGAQKTQTEDAVANMEPDDPRIPGTPDPYPNKGVYEAEGSWTGNHFIRRYIWARIKGLHTGGQWPYEVFSEIAAGGTGEATARGYHAYDELGRRMLAKETETNLDWSANLTTGISGIDAGEATVEYHFWEHIIREPYLDPHHRYIVETEKEGQAILLTGGITSAGFGNVGKIVMFAHWQYDITENTTPSIDGSVVVDSQFCDIYETGATYEALDPIALGHSNPDFNEAYRQLIVLGRQRFLPSWPGSYNQGITFSGGSSRAYVCMPLTPSEIIMPEITAYQWNA